MDCRVKPGNDERMGAIPPYGLKRLWDLHENNDFHIVG